MSSRPGRSPKASKPPRSAACIDRHTLCFIVVDHFAAGATHRATLQTQLALY